METIKTAVLIGHTVVALVIIILVLLQRGKGADAGAAFGAGASGTVFGSRGSTSFFSRMTAILATVFFASSLTLAYLSSQTSGGPSSILEDAPALEVEEEEAAAPDDDTGLPELPSADDAAETGDADLPSLPPQPDNESDPEQE